MTETPLYIVGHVNPDMDAIASAMGYAWLLHTRDDAPTVAARAGKLNPQSEWVLTELGLTPPELLTDAAPKFDRVARLVKPLTPDQSVRMAWATSVFSHVPTPVVDAENMPVGLFTGDALFAWLATSIASQRIDLDNVTVGGLLEQPCAEMLEKDAPRFPLSMRVRDARLRMLHEERRAFWVVHENGTYYGIARKSDILNAPRIRIILVDHNEPSQSVSSLSEADVLEVVDHHRLGNASTHTPIAFTVDTVGSTSTLITERIVAARLKPPQTIAMLLLSGVLSDTLVLRSPTTTVRDHEAARTLADWADLKDYKAYGAQMLRAGAGLSSRDVSISVTSDLKLYDTTTAKFGIAQIEVSQMSEFDEHYKALEIALEQLCAQHNLDIAVLMVTDVVEGGSRLMLFGERAGQLRDLPYMRLPDGTIDAPGLVSRKKQLLPNILALLEPGSY